MAFDPFDMQVYKQSLEKAIASSNNPRNKGYTRDDQRGQGSCGSNPRNRAYARDDDQEQLSSAGNPRNKAYTRDADRSGVNTTQSLADRISSGAPDMASSLLRHSDIHVEDCRKSSEGLINIDFPMPAPIGPSKAKNSNKWLSSNTFGSKFTLIEKLNGTLHVIYIEKYAAAQLTLKYLQREACHIKGFGMAADATVQRLPATRQLPHDASRVLEIHAEKPAEHHFAKYSQVADRCTRLSVPFLTQLGPVSRESQSRREEPP